MTKNLLNYRIREIMNLLKIDERRAREIKKIARKAEWVYGNRTRDVYYLMEQYDELLNGSGVEHVGDEYCDNFKGVDYVNMGDTYDTTIIYDHDQDKFGIGNWGRYVEYYDFKCNKKDEWG